MQLAQLLPLASSVGVSLVCAGVAYVQIVKGRERSGQVRALTGKVKERYAAYVELEERIRKVFARFDERECEYQVQLAEHAEEIQRLQATLEENGGLTAELESDLGRVLSEFGMDVPESEVSDGPRGDGTLMDVLSRCFDVLRELPGFLREQGEELDRWESRCRAAEQSASEEVRALRARIDELEAAGTESAEVWEQRCQELESRVPALEERAIELSGELATAKREVADHETELEAAKKEERLLEQLLEKRA